MRLNHIFRRLVRLPVFTTVAIGTLAIGIGAHTAMFSVLQAILLEPLPYSNPDELIVIDHTVPGVNIHSAGAAEFLYFTYRDDARTLRSIGLWRTGAESITGAAAPEEVRVLRVTAAVLPMLGIQPVLGRAFSAEDDSPGGARTVLATAGYWKTKLGGSTAAIGLRIPYSVSQRTKEIGVRVALGAKSGDVMRMFVAHGLRLAAVGIACGLVAAYAATRLLATLLFNVSPLDPLTYAAVATSLLAATVLATYLPALRAASVDPVEALRAE